MNGWMDKWAIVFLPFEQDVFDASDAGRALCVCGCGKGIYMMAGTHNFHVIQYTVVRCMFNVNSARQCSLLYACIPFCVCI